MGVSVVVVVLLASRIISRGRVAAVEVADMARVRCGDVVVASGDGDGPCNLKGEEMGEEIS